MGQLVFSEPSSSAGSSTVENARQEALRKAGAEYFEKVLEQARKGQNVLNEAPRPRQVSKDVEAQDEDLEAVGQAIPYAVAVLYAAAMSARLVLLKLSLASLVTPAIQLFLHLLPVVGVMYAVVDVKPLTAKSLKASSVSIAFYAVQTLALFGALAFSSLYLVLAWTTLAPPVLTWLSPWKSNSSRPGPLRLLLMVTGSSGAVVALVLGLWPSPVGLLCLLSWSAIEVGKTLWQQFKADPEALPAQLGGAARELLAPIAAEEAKLPLATKAFFSSAMTAVPALLIGFLCQEGSTLVEHELSVPEVSSILLSCGVWTVGGVSGAFLFQSVSERTQARLTAFAALVALAVQVFMAGVGSQAAFLAALLAVIGGVGAQQYEP